MIGVRFRETHDGTMYFLDRPTEERLVQVDVTVTLRALRTFLRDRIADLEGRLSIEGFASDRRVRGSVALRPLEDKRAHFEMKFEADDGETYLLSADKDVQLLALAGTFSTFDATLFDDEGAEVARGRLRFRPREELWPLLKSVRPFFGSAS